jgi:hypothetical protein
MHVVRGFHVKTGVNDIEVVVKNCGFLEIGDQYLGNLFDVEEGKEILDVASKVTGEVGVVGAVELAVV